MPLIRWVGSVRALAENAGVGPNTAFLQLFEPFAMTLAFVSILINALISFSFFVRDDISAGFREGAALICLGFVAVSFLGLLAHWATGKKAFAYLAIAGFVPFVPIGLIGIFGVKKLLNAQPSEADVASAGAQGA